MWPSPGEKKFGLTVSECIEYYVCSYILRGKKTKPDLKNYLHWKKEIFVGYALYNMYEDRIKRKDIFNKKNIAIIESFNYEDYI